MDRTAVKVDRPPRLDPVISPMNHSSKSSLVDRILTNPELRVRAWVSTRQASGGTSGVSQGLQGVFVPWTAHTPDSQRHNPRVWMALFMLRRAG
jgi:hypothetical protein